MRANERGAYVGDICVSGVRLSKSHQCTQGHRSTALAEARAASSFTNTAHDNLRTSALLRQLSVRAEFLPYLHSDVGAGLPCQ